VDRGALMMMAMAHRAAHVGALCAAVFSGSGCTPPDPDYKSAPQYPHDSGKEAEPSVAAQNYVLHYPGLFDYPGLSDSPLESGELSWVPISADWVSTDTWTGAPVGLEGSDSSAKTTPGPPIADNAHTWSSNHDDAVIHIDDDFVLLPSTYFIHPLLHDTAYVWEADEPALCGVEFLREDLLFGFIYQTRDGAALEHDQALGAHLYDPATGAISALDPSIPIDESVTVEMNCDLWARATVSLPVALSAAQLVVLSSAPDALTEPMLLSTPELGAPPAETAALPAAAPFPLLTAAGTEGLLRHPFLIEDVDGDAVFTDADTVLGPLLAADGAPVAVLWLPEATAADPAIALQRARMRGGWSVLEWREERWSQADAEARWTVAR
jgi:hypothetical protein